MHLRQGGADRYAVCFDCSAPVEKGVYHGSLAWSIALVPLRGQQDIPEATVTRIEAGLAGLPKDHHGA
jgi:hypothetical protein